MFPRRLRGALSISFALAVTMLPALVPATLAAQGLSLTTQFPAVTVTPGTMVSIDLAVDANVDARVALSVSGVPASCSSTAAARPRSTTRSTTSRTSSPK